MEKGRALKSISVATVLIAGIVVFSTLVLLALGAIFWTRERLQRNQEFERRSSATADRLATALAYPIWNYDEEYVGLILAGLMEDPEVRGVSLLRPARPLISLSRDINGTLRNEQGQVLPGERTLHRELFHEKHRMGAIDIHFSPASVRAADSDSIGAMVGLVFTFNLLLVLGLYLFLWRLTLKPLKMIENYAVAVSTGDPAKAVAPGSFWGELENVRTSIERMVGELEERLARLRRSESKFHSIFDGTSDAIIVRLAPGSGSAGPLVEVNDVACEKLGYTREKFLKLPFDDLFADPEAARRLRAASRRYEARLRDSEGREIGFEIHEQTVDIDGAPHTILAGRDISERESLEEDLRQAHKMEAVGRLAGGIAHDFNNLLTAILGYCEVLELEKNLTGRNREYLEQIKKASNRAASLTRQLLAFSRKQILQPKLICLTELATETFGILERIVGEDIKLKLMIGDEEGCVWADPGQLNQVLMNLTINARDAMPQGGTLTLGIHRARFDSARRHAGQTFPAGEYVELSVSDTGTGMEEAVVQKLFEPFFTTKGVGKGTGLGLATVHGIVVQSGGYITVESKPGDGTTFRILLPRKAREEEEPGRAEGLPGKMVGGAETILLVEDSLEVRAIAKGVLGNLGYNVLEASSGGEAEEVAAAFDGPIHLLLTDVVMPGISGQVLAGRLKPLRPEMRVIYMSGYTENAIVHHGVLEEGINFIPKPFLPSELAAKVRETLSASG